MKLTFIEYSVHIKSIGGTGLIVSAATHIYTQLLDPLVLNHTGVSATNLICRKKNTQSWYATPYIAQLNIPETKTSVSLTLRSNRYNGDFCYVTICT